MNKNNPVLVTCAHCKGVGKRALPALQAKILSAVVGLGSATAEQVIRKLGRGRSRIAHSTMNNRLARLAAQGVLTRTKSGRVWTYSPAQAPR